MKTPEGTKYEERPFKIAVPGETGNTYVTIQVPMAWDDVIDEWVMTPKGIRMVEDEQADLIATRTNRYQHRKRKIPV